MRPQGGDNSRASSHGWESGLREPIPRHSCSWATDHLSCAEILPLVCMEHHHGVMLVRVIRSGTCRDLALQGLAVEVAGQPWKAPEAGGPEWDRGLGLFLKSSSRMKENPLWARGQVQEEERVQEAGPSERVVMQQGAPAAQWKGIISWSQSRNPQQAMGITPDRGSAPWSQQDKTHRPWSKIETLGHGGVGFSASSELWCCHKMVWETWLGLLRHKNLLVRNRRALSSILTTGENRK